MNDLFNLIGGLMLLLLALSVLTGAADGNKLRLIRGQAPDVKKVPRSGVMDQIRRDGLTVLIGATTILGGIRWGRVIRKERK